MSTLNYTIEQKQVKWFKEPLQWFPLGRMNYLAGTTILELKTNVNLKNNRLSKRRINATNLSFNTPFVEENKAQRNVAGNDNYWHPFD